MGGKGKRKNRRKDEKREDEHGGDEHCDGSHQHEHRGCEHSNSGMGKTTAKASGTTGKRKSRNAYEMQPKPPRRSKVTETNP